MLKEKSIIFLFFVIAVIPRLVLSEEDSGNISRIFYNPVMHIGGMLDLSYEMDFKDQVFEPRFRLMMTDITEYEGYLAYAELAGGINWDHPHEKEPKGYYWIFELSYYWAKTTEGAWEEERSGISFKCGVGYYWILSSGLRVELEVGLPVFPRGEIRTPADHSWATPVGFFGIKIGIPIGKIRSFFSDPPELF